MDLVSGSSFIDFYNQIDILLLIMIRLLAFFIVLPIFSGVNIPNTVKVTFSFAVAIMLFLSGAVTEVHYSNSVMGYLLLMIQEFFVGFSIAFVIYIIFSLIYFSGQLIDYQLGLSMMSVYDPISQIQVPIVGNLFYFIICFLLVHTGGLNAFIGAMFHSYRILPIGSAMLLGNNRLIMYMLQLVTQFFVTGVQIAMPIMGSILIVDIVLGLLVKAVPQMNVFVVGMPLKVLVGFFLLYFTAPLILSVYDFTFRDSYRAIMNMLRGMTP